MTPSQHGQISKKNVVEWDQERCSKQEEAISDLLSGLAERDPDLHRYLRLRLAGSEPSRGGRPAPISDPEEPVMIGDSPPMHRVFKAIRRFAATDAPILVTGESGTGKELAALAIHERSSYASGPFMPINCAGLPPTLISTELFGHEKGAFTGAARRKIGRIEAAQGGTVFLDEIGDMPMELQAHLLRFLQERTIERVGGHRPIPVDVRVVAATNKDLTQEVEAGRFRQDLFFRLNVLTLEMPRLCDRGDDVELFSTVFVQRFAKELKGVAKGFSQCAQAAIRSHPWPGNVRELISRIRRAVVMADGDLITAEDLGLAEPPPASDVAVIGPAGVESPMVSVPIAADDSRVLTLEEAKSRLEEVVVRAALERNAFNVTAAASELGVSRVTLYRHIDRFGLKSARSAAAC